MDLYRQDDQHHLKLSAPMPTLPFMDIRENDLPYGGKNLIHDSLAKSPQFGPTPPSLKKQGASILASLTGVHAELSPSQKACLPGCGRPKCKLQSEEHWNLAGLDTLQDAKAKKPASARSQPASTRSQRAKRCFSCSTVDESVDTSDLQGLVFDVETESDAVAAQASSSSSSDADDEEDRGRQDKALVERSSQEYFALVKESMGRIGLRAQMLQELSLGDTPARDAPSPAPGRPAATSPAAEADVPYMSHTSISVRHARKLAGSMHIDEQAIDLRDILKWLHNLGAISEEGSKEYAQRASSKPETADEMKMRLQNVGASDWRLPASPPIALHLAGEDLQNRLANLFQEKNFLNDKLKTLQNDDNVDEELEKKPEEFLVALRSLEEEYELLGASVSQNLETAERLEERYQLLEQQLNATGNSAGKHLDSVNKLTRLVGPEGLEDLKKIPEPPKPDPEQKEEKQPEKEPEEKPEEDTEAKRKRKKSKSPELSSDGDGQPIVQPPIRIQSKVYPGAKRSSSPKLGKEEDGKGRPSPDKPDKQAISKPLRSSEEEDGGHKTVIQTLEAEKSKPTKAQQDKAQDARSKTTEDTDRKPAARKQNKRDRAVQTDPVTIFSLISESEHVAEEPAQEEASNIDEMVSARTTVVSTPKSTAPSTPMATRASPAAAAKETRRYTARGPSPTGSTDKRETSVDSSKVKMLSTELEKSKKQLNFYRARNWGEKHQAHPVPTPVSSAREVSDPLPGGGQDIGLIFVYNPTSGFHTMLTAGDVGGQKARPSTYDRPTSAPASLSRSLPVNTSNKVVSAQQVMRLIANRRDQQSRPR